MTTKPCPNGLHTTSSLECRCWKPAKQAHTPPATPDCISIPALCGCLNHMNGVIEFCALHKHAPDLLAALKEVERDSGDWQLRKLAREVIARAEGR